MANIEWIERIKKWLRDIYNSKVGNILIKVFISFFLMFLGGLTYALFLSKTNLTSFQKLGIFISSIIGLMSMALLLIEKIFRIEVHEKQLQLTERQIESNLIDEKSIGKKIVNHVVRLISSELNSQDSIYEERSKHYRGEKELIADKFVDMLGDRVNFLKNNGIQNIQIIFDSGTTIAPIFNQLGLKSSTDNNHWSKYVEIITNNIKGIQFILKYREGKGTESYDPINDRYLDIPIRCAILPGKILSAYEAIADETTLKAIRILGKRKNAYTICVTTGNYILYDFNKRNFMPIARTGFHPHIKATLYYISDEIYVVAPLGKILKGEINDTLEKLLNKFNKDLEHSQSSPIASQWPYVLINNNSVTEHLPTHNFEPEIGE